MYHPLVPQRLDINNVKYLNLKITQFVNSITYWVIIFVFIFSQQSKILYKSTFTE